MDASPPSRQKRYRRRNALVRTIYVLGDLLLVGLTLLQLATRTPAPLPVPSAETALDAPEPLPLVERRI